MKLYVTQATNAVLIQSSHSPSAALLDMVSCQTAECTFCSASNSWQIFCWASLARIVDRPLNVAERCENTGLRAVLKKG